MFSLEDYIDAHIPPKKFCYCEMRGCPHHSAKENCNNEAQEHACISYLGEACSDCIKYTLDIYPQYVYLTVYEDEHAEALDMNDAYNSAFGLAVW